MYSKKGAGHRFAWGGLERNAKKREKIVKELGARAPLRPRATFCAERHLA
jgi:hypothetical protein